MRSGPLKRTTSTLIAFSLGVLPSFACAGWSTIEYSWTAHPIYPVKAYTQGKLGIVKPTFDSQYLVIAYRYFAGKSLSAHESDEANEMIEHRLAREDTGCSAVNMNEWIEARKSVLGGPDPSIETSANTAGDSPSTICNIQTNAFVTAAKTLHGLVTKFGAKSDAVKEWIAAQDMVFANSGGTKPSIPKPLTAGDKILAQHRAYQIAAANFYAMNFDQASALFSQIGQEADSPWSHIAKYLAMRCLVRQASLKADPFDENMMKQVKPKLDALLKDKSMVDLHDDLVDLADFVNNKVQASDLSFAKQREHHLAAAVMVNITDRNLLEYTDAFDRFSGAVDSDGARADKKPTLLNGVDDITDWIDTYQAPRGISNSRALTRWTATKSMPWLIAALSKAGAADKEAQQLIDEALKVPASSHAYSTVVYEAARLLTEKKQYDQARSCVDKLLAQKDLDRSSHNLLQELRLRLARNVDEFARDSMAKSVGSGGDYDSANDDESKVKPSLMTLTENMYDQNIPLTVLKAACQSKNYDAETRKTLTKMAFVRSILIENDAVARAVATDLMNSDKPNAQLYKSYLQASTPAEKKFAAAFVLLRDEGATPAFNRGNGWWWNSTPTTPPDSEAGDPDPPGWNSALFLSAADRAAAGSELRKLTKVSAAPAYLGAITVAWSKSHPQDPRVPEALHMTVRCTRFGEEDTLCHKLSKEAFMILHHQYAKNKWTAETPYYY